MGESNRYTAGSGVAEGPAETLICTDGQGGILNTESADGALRLREDRPASGAVRKAEQPTADFTANLDAVLGELRAMLLDKNRKYGNSALEPIRVFSQASADEQLLVRMDDKLSRIRTATADDAEDAHLDLMGYLLLHRISRIAAAAAG